MKMYKFIINPNTGRQLNINLTKGKNYLIRGGIYTICISFSNLQLI